MSIRVYNGLMLILALSVQLNALEIPEMNQQVNTVIPPLFRQRMGSFI